MLKGRQSLPLLKGNVVSGKRQGKQAGKKSKAKPIGGKTKNANIKSSDSVSKKAKTPDKALSASKSKKQLSKPLKGAKSKTKAKSTIKPKRNLPKSKPTTKKPASKNPSKPPSSKAKVNTQARATTKTKARVKTKQSRLESSKHPKKLPVRKKMPKNRWVDGEREAIVYTCSRCKKKVELFLPAKVVCSKCGNVMKTIEISA
jgi:DNA-directed RNA polymerase subunit RPC12/RpoP